MREYTLIIVLGVVNIVADMVQLYLVVGDESVSSCPVAVVSQFHRVSFRVWLYRIPSLGPKWRLDSNLESRESIGSKSSTDGYSTKTRISSAGVVYGCVPI